MTLSEYYGNIWKETHLNYLDFAFGTTEGRERYIFYKEYII